MNDDALTETLRCYLREHVGHGAAAAYLFGSQARGDVDPHSDVDIAVLFNREVAPALMSPTRTIQGDLERRLRCNVDVIDLARAPVDLVHRVLRDGVVLHVTDERARIAFEVDARNRYFDLLPYLRQYRHTSVA